MILAGRSHWKSSKREVEVRFGGHWKCGPCPRATQLGLSKILPKPQWGRATKSQEGGATRISESRTSNLQWGGDASQDHEKVEGMVPTHQLHNSAIDTHWVCPKPLTLYSSLGQWLLSWADAPQGGAKRNLESRAIGSLPAPSWWEGPKKDDICAAVGDSAQEVPVVVPSALYPEPHTPDFPHVTLACSALCLPEPRVSGCEHWPFKRALVSLPDFCVFLEDRNLTNLHSHMLCGHLFVALVLWAGSMAWGWGPCFSGNPCSWDIPLETQLLPGGGGPAYFVPLPFLPVLMWLLL